MSTQLNSVAAMARIVDSVRDKMSGSEFNVAFAAMIFLRWADFEEAEREAIAAFEDFDNEPAPPSLFKWRDLYDRNPNELEPMIRRLPELLGHFCNSKHKAIASVAHHVVPAVDKLSRLPVDVVASMIEWMSHQSFETPADRRFIRDMLGPGLLDSSLAQ